MSANSCVHACVCGCARVVTVSHHRSASERWWKHAPSEADSGRLVFLFSLVVCNVPARHRYQVPYVSHILPTCVGKKRKGGGGLFPFFCR